MLHIETIHGNLTDCQINVFRLHSPLPSPGEWIDSLPDAHIIPTVQPEQGFGIMPPCWLTLGWVGRWHAYRILYLQGGAKVACQTPDSSPRSVHHRLCQRDSNTNTQIVCDLGSNHNPHSRRHPGSNVNARSNPDAYANTTAYSHCTNVTSTHTHFDADAHSHGAGRRRAV